MAFRIKNKYIAGTAQILQQSQQEKVPYTVEVVGKTFTVLPGVFSPKYFHDTAFFAENLPVKEGDEMLEIGPGTGVISVNAALQGAKRVVAVDINPQAVKNTQANIGLHHMEQRVSVLYGDLYEPLKSTDRFDLIFWNTPFAYVEEQHLSDLERSVSDPGYRATKRFIDGAGRHLKPGGRLFIGFSSTLGHMQLLKTLLKEAGFRTRLIAEQWSKETHPVKFQLFMSTLLQSVQSKKE